MKKLLVLVLALTLLGGVFACGSKGAGKKDGITLDKTEITLEVSDSETIIVSTEEKYSGGTAFTWASSDEAIATVAIPSKLAPEKARITAKAVGTATVTATSDNGKTASVTVTVIPKTALSATKLTLVTGETADFPIENADGYTYATENDKIVTVNATTGEINAVGIGSTRVYAEKDSKKFFVSVQVERAFANALVTDTDLALPLKDFTGYALTSSNNAVATVSANGKITPVSAGRVVFTATKDGKSVDFEYGILDGKQTSVTLSATADDRFNLFGRTKFNTSTSAQEFYYTSSGFDVTFYGTELKGNFKTYKSGEYVTWLSVFVDGESMTNASLNPSGDRVIKLDTDGEKTIVSGLTKGWHTVKVRKRTAFQRGGTAMDYFAVKSFTVTDSDGYIGYAPIKSDFKIEVYGDSISCGYGNLTDGKTMNTENTDGLMTYHSIFANTLGADLTVNACSGWGVMWGNDKGTTWVWPDYWKKLHARSSETYANAGGADMIIINLGENDSVAVNAGSPIADFTAKYVAWLTDLRLANPDAVIICTYGMMGQQQNMKNGITAAVNQMNDSKIMAYYYTNKASSDHPTVDVHKACAQELLSFCEQNNLLP